MLTGRTFAGKRLPLTLAFAVLVAAAIGAGCHGFFVNPTLSSIAIQPPDAQILIGKTLTFQAWGTYDDGSRSQIKSGVVWSSDSSAITIDQNTGVATAVDIGTATITASAQALSNTASATSYIVVSSLVVDPDKWNLNTSGGTQDFTVTANGSDDVTSGATFTPSNTTFFSCPNGTSPVTCTATNPTAGNYTITVTYPGTTLAPTIAVTVSP